MANRIQQITVSMLGKPEMRPVGIKVIGETIVKGLKGDTAAISEALVMCAEIFRQGQTFPPELVPFLVISLNQSATSNEACAAIATLGGKKVKGGAHARHAQDSDVYAHELSLRESIPKQAARVAYLAEHYHRSNEGIRTILKRASKSPRVIDQVLSQVGRFPKKAKK
jgi:hypothetical protein